MDIVRSYLDFKKKWLYKLVYQISNLYETEEQNLIWEKTIDEFLKTCINDIVENKYISDNIFEETMFNIDNTILDKVDNNILKVVLNTFNKPDFIMGNYSLSNIIYITVLLEATLEVYRVTFGDFKKGEIEEILRNNIINTNIVFLRKLRTLNIIYSYLEYINKKLNNLFGILSDKRFMVNLISLSNEYRSYLCNYGFNIDSIYNGNYDNDIINEIYEDKIKDKKFYILGLNLLRLKILLNYEIGTKIVNKVLWNIDNDIFDKSVIKKINSFEYIDFIDNKIIFINDNIDNSYDIKYKIGTYIKDDIKLKSATKYKNNILVVNKSFFKNNDKDEKRFKNNNIKFIVINDNVKYLLNRDEVD